MVDIDIIKLPDLVEYQEGSVVSKTMVKKEAGTLTIFAFDKGQGLSEHTAPFDVLITILDGEAEISVNQEKVILKAGESIQLLSDQPHSLKAIKRFKMLLLMIKS